VITVQEFVELPNPAGENYFELHHGEIVSFPFPARIQRDVQHRVHGLLQSCAGNQGVVQMELAFRAEAEYELRGADVGYVRRERFASIPPDDFLRGAPDLTVLIESAANKAAAVDEEEVLCLANGCSEFWIVYPYRKIIRVSTGETVKRYGIGDSIPLSVLPGRQIAVSGAFAGL
jgi:hypothetical protein